MKVQLGFITIIALTLMGCGSSPSSVDPEMLSYYKDFYKEAESRGISLDDVDVGFSDENLGHSTVGVCNTGQGDRNNVQISKSSWNELNDGQKRWTIYHELAHCTLGKDHESETQMVKFYTDQYFYYYEVSKTMMAEKLSAVNVTMFKNYQKEYLDNLFLNKDVSFPSQIYVQLNEKSYRIEGNRVVINWTPRFDTGDYSVYRNGVLLTKTSSLQFVDDNAQSGSNRYLVIPNGLRVSGMEAFWPEINKD